MKNMRRAPFEVLYFRDHSIPLWGKAPSVLGSKTPYVHAYVVKFSYQGWMEFKCEPPLFARVEKSLRFLTWNSSKFLYTDK